jgi:hypothetical protein
MVMRNVPVKDKKSILQYLEKGNVIGLDDYYYGSLSDWSGDKADIVPRYFADRGFDANCYGVQEGCYDECEELPFNKLNWR